MIRKCLTVTPSKRVTVDDIAAHWWVNLGYKYPPVHYYLTPAMRQNGLPMPSHVPALTYTERPKTSNVDSEQITKTTPSSHRVKQAPLLSITGPPASTHNGNHTDNSTRSKPSINGYQTLGRSHRLFTNGVPNMNGAKLKFNPPKRRTSLERNQNRVVSPSKIPIPRKMIY